MKITDKDFERFKMTVQTDLVETMDEWLAGKQPVWSYERIIKQWPMLEPENFRFERRVQQTLDTGVIEPYDFNVEVWQTLHWTREFWVDHFGFAIPCAEVLDACAEYGPIVEVGAGTGYMTKLMRNHGISVIGSDPEEKSYGWSCGQFDTVQARTDATTMVARHTDRTVFCSWPSYQEPWFEQALNAMAIGQGMIVIRESACADDSAWSYFDDCFETVRQIDIPTFPFMHDYCDIRVKKRQVPK